MAEITEFGKALRKIRADREEIIPDMAKVLGVTGPYVSAVETGIRRAPALWVEKIIKAYKLDPDEAQELRTAFEHSQDEVRIQLFDLSKKQKQTAIAFSKAIGSLSDEDLEKIEFLCKQKTTAYH